MITTTETLSIAAGRSRNRSGVSWGAIFAGAAGAAALSLILILLGIGLGFSAVSPWTDQGVSAKGLGISAILWLAITQLIASGLGGYLAGRLRVKWGSLHGDEVFFRDTAHGFLAWAVATLLTAALVVSSAGGVLGGGAQASASVASGAANALGTTASGAIANNGSDDDHGYFVDALLRDDRSVAVSNDAAYGVVARIFGKTLAQGGQLDPADRTYLAQVVAQRTDLTQAEAEQRVDEVFGKARQAVEDAKQTAKEAADTASKVAAWTSLWMFIALLCGAFFASLCATYGGRRRDAVNHLDAEEYPNTSAPRTL